MHAIYLPIEKISRFCDCPLVDTHAEFLREYAESYIYAGAV
jgi:hypothetical protein